MEIDARMINNAIERVLIDMNFIAENDPDGILKVMEAYRIWLRHTVPVQLEAMTCQ